MEIFERIWLSKTDIDAINKCGIPEMINLQYILKNMLMLLLCYDLL